MDKSPEAFRTISEVAEALAVPQHVLRFWESRFPQIKPMKRGGGRRYYRPDDVDLLRAIKRLLYDEGYTIKGVQKMLREQGAGSLARSEAPEIAEPAPVAAAPMRIEPVLRRAEPAAANDAPPLITAPKVAEPAPAALALRADEIAELRAILTDLREAQRILTQARAH